MSDDTRERMIDSVQRPLISADDASGDMLTTVTIKVENAEGWYEVEFKSKVSDLVINAESYSPAQFLAEHGDGTEFYHPEAMIRAWPGKRVNRVSLAAIPQADPESGTIYVKRTQPPEG